MLCQLSLFVVFLVYVVFCFFVLVVSQFVMEVNCLENSSPK